MIRYVGLIALMCALPLWSSAENELPLDGASRVRLAIAQEARAKRIQALYPGELKYLTGTKGFCINLPHEHYGLFPRLLLLEKERLLVAFYLCDEHPVSQSEEIEIATKVRAASSLDLENEGSLSQLADVKEEIAYRALYERYYKKYMALSSVAPRMVRVNGLVTQLSSRFPDLGQNDRWFLRMHLFCLPGGAFEEDAPLDIYAKDPASLIAQTNGSWEGLKAYLKTQIAR